MKKTIALLIFLNVALVSYTQRNISVREAISAATCKLKCMYDYPDTRVLRVNTSQDVEGNVLLYEVVFREHYSTGEWGVFHGEYSDPFSNINLECATTSIAGYGNATGPYYLSEDIELSYSEMTRTAEVMPKTNVQATVTTVCNN